MASTPCNVLPHDKNDGERIRAGRRGQGWQCMLSPRHDPGRTSLQSLVSKTKALSTRPQGVLLLCGSCSRRQAKVLGRQASRTCRPSSRIWRLEGDRRLAAICRRHEASCGSDSRSLDSEPRVLTVTPRGQLHEMPFILSTWPSPAFRGRAMTSQHAFPRKSTRQP